MTDLEQYESLIEEALKEGVQKIVCGAVVIYKNKILLLKRSSDEFLPGLIELPSGNKEAREPILDCLKREVREETGLDFEKIDKYLKCFDYLSSSEKKTRQFNFLVKGVGKITINPNEHEKYFLLPLNLSGMEKLNISSETKDVLGKLKQL